MVILNEMAECRESAQLLIALVHLPLLVFGLPYILWCVSCLRRVVAFWVKPGVLVVVVANSDTNLRMCNNISNASLVHYNYWCAYYPDTCHGHSSIRITLDTRHGHTNLALYLIAHNTSPQKKKVYVCKTEIFTIFLKCTQLHLQFQFYIGNLIIMLVISNLNQLRIQYKFRELLLLLIPLY
ncbi:hypothetical protein AGLY_017447 [Aphis glycines]|uniref:Uncharacterized protein n=1 Tax=Aphis glycines TaxID=307491 RepID=A0A6G0SX02_APHGL|nr:hypothetical protein AGLY_017447 [Aphis glycines]